MEICLIPYSLLLSSDSKTRVTFYGGIHEIGGNKFLIEDKGTKIFLDFGMQMGKSNFMIGVSLIDRHFMLCTVRYFV